MIDIIKKTPSKPSSKVESTLNPKECEAYIIVMNHNTPIKKINSLEIS